MRAFRDNFIIVIENFQVDPRVYTWVVIGLESVFFEEYLVQPIAIDSEFKFKIRID